MTRKEQLENKLEELKEEQKKVEAELAASAKWPPVFNGRDRYWLINSLGGSVYDSWLNTTNDNSCLRWGNAFPSKREAELESKRIELLRCPLGPIPPSQEELENGWLALHGGVVSANGHDYGSLMYEYLHTCWHPTKEAAEAFIQRRQVLIEEMLK